MVYNKSFYRSESLTEKLRAKFGERTADAILRATSGNQNTEDGTPDKVMSFFGREGSSGNTGRSIPSAKRPQNAHSAQRETRVAASNNRGAKYARTAEPKKRPAQAARPASARPAREQRTAQQNVRRDVRPANKTVKTAKTDPKVYTGTFGKAYMAGDRIKGIASRIGHPKAARYTKRTVSKQALKKGRADVAGSRHASVRSDFGPDGDKSKFRRFLDTFRDNHKAEHRVKQAPFPFAYATIVVICAFMAMVLLFSYSQVEEYKSKIGDLSATQAELSATADKLEVELELRDDIRKIESYAVDYIGMVNSDVVQTKFVNVQAEDRVEILKAEEEEVEGGFSALLSAIGEGIGKFSEYFN